MFNNIILLDSIWLSLFFWILLESCFIIFLYILFNLIYRERDYLVKSSILLSISLIYNYTFLFLQTKASNLLIDNYIRYIDFTLAIISPFLMLASLYAFYLVIKKKKMQYIIACIYIIFYYESIILAPIIKILYQAPPHIDTDFWFMIRSVIFLVIVALIEFKLFYTIRGTNNEAKATKFETNSKQ